MLQVERGLVDADLHLIHPTGIEPKLSRLFRIADIEIQGERFLPWPWPFERHDEIRSPEGPAAVVDELERNRKLFQAGARFGRNGDSEGRSPFFPVNPCVEAPRVEARRNEEQETEKGFHLWLAEGTGGK